MPDPTPRHGEVFKMFDPPGSDPSPSPAMVEAGADALIELTEPSTGLLTVLYSEAAKAVLTAALRLDSGRCIPGYRPTPDPERAETLTREETLELASEQLDNVFEELLDNGLAVKPGEDALIARERLAREVAEDLARTFSAPASDPETVGRRVYEALVREWGAPWNALAQSTAKIVCRALLNTTDDKEAQ